MYPNLIKTDYHDFLLFELIDGKEGWNKSYVDQKSLLNALLAFNFSKLKMDFGLPKRLAFRWVRSTRVKIVKWSHSLNGYGYSNSFKILFLLIVSELRQRNSQSHLVIHNDISANHNIISYESGKVYIVDFESVTIEKKWLLIDIMSLSAISKDDALLDRHMLKYYIDALREKEVVPPGFDIKLQSRIVLLRMCLQRYGFTPGPQLKNKLGRYLVEVLLDNKAYSTWYAENIAL